MRNFLPNDFHFSFNLGPSLSFFTLFIRLLLSYRKNWSIFCFSMKPQKHSRLLFPQRQGERADGNFVINSDMYMRTSTGFTLMNVITIALVAMLKNGKLSTWQIIWKLDDYKLKFEQNLIFKSFHLVLENVTIWSQNKCGKFYKLIEKACLRRVWN